MSATELRELLADPARNGAYFVDVRDREALEDSARELGCAIATIDLAGQTYLERIELNDKQGDRTDIALSQHQLTPAQLTDDERQRFAAQ